MSDDGRRTFTEEREQIIGVGREIGGLAVPHRILAPAAAVVGHDVEVIEFRDDSVEAGPFVARAVHQDDQGRGQTRQTRAG